MRIASLLPSATEIVCALGLGDSLVGVSHECDYPPEVIGRPVLTEPKIDVSADSAGIDSAVRRLVRDGLSVYRIKTDVLRQLQPDLIVTQEQCEVCAVSYRDVVDATRQLLEQPAAIVSLKPVRLDDLFDDMQRVADAAACSPAGVALTQQLAGTARRHPDARRLGAQPAACGMHRMDGAAHGGRQLDPRAGCARWRHLRHGSPGCAQPDAELGRPGALRA